MKFLKSIALMMSLVLISSFVLAATPRAPDNDMGQPEIVNTMAKTSTPSEGQQVENKEQVRSQLDELKQSMQQKQQQLNAEFEGSSNKAQQMMNNQNQVKVAAQTLSQMENMLGNKGQQISAIAKEFNNSVQATINSEEKIQAKNAFSRLFTGGNKEAGEELNAQVIKNQEQIQELKQLKEETDCDEEVKVMMQEQINQMEGEQQRLQELAQKEISSKGMFGWIWK